MTPFRLRSRLLNHVVRIDCRHRPHPNHHTGIDRETPPQQPKLPHPKHTEPPNDSTKQPAPISSIEPNQDEKLVPHPLCLLHHSNNQRRGTHTPRRSGPWCGSRHSPGQCKKYFVEIKSRTIGRCFDAMGGHGSTGSTKKSHLSQTRSMGYPGRFHHAPSFWSLRGHSRSPTTVYTG